MSIKLSVIICTHNPRLEFLARTLQSLSKQNINHADWELILIDNNSDVPVSGLYDISWHKNCKIVCEPQVGLTHARMRGVAESVGSVLCCIDDDNILAHNYLKEVLRIADEMPYIGCWGGEIHGEYEVTPPNWFFAYQEMVVVRPLSRDKWANAYRYDDALPCGAGLCVRRDVVNLFLQNCKQSPLRLSLGRAGQSLGSGEDVDLAYTAIDLGYGTGRFKALQMTHLIPATRLKQEYLIKLYENMWESAVYVDSLRNETRGNIPIAKSWYSKLFFRLKNVRLSRFDQKMAQARVRGIEKGLRKLKQKQTFVS